MLGNRGDERGQPAVPVARGQVFVFHVDRRLGLVVEKALRRDGDIDESRGDRGAK